MWNILWCAAHLCVETRDSFISKGFSYSFPREKYFVPMDFQVPSAIRLRSLQLNMEVSLWKHVKCFPSNVRLTKLKTQQSSGIGILDCCWENHIVIVMSLFLKSFVLRKWFPSTAHLNAKPGFQIPPVWRVVSPCFSDGYRVDARPYRKNVDAFFKFHRCNLNQTWYFCWQLPCGTKVLQVLIFWVFSRFHFLQKKI